MFGIGTWELILIVIIAMLVIGPEKTVEFTRRGGQLLAKLRSQTDQVTKEFREALATESEELSDLKDANPLTAINELRDEANAAARDFQNVLSGKPVTSNKQAKAAATPKQQAEPASQTSTGDAPADAVPADGTTHESEGIAAEVEATAAEAVAEESFTEGLELDGPVLVEEDEVTPADEGVDAAKAIATDEETLPTAESGAQP